MATAAGGLIALFGVISTQRANVRKEYYERKTEVYREVLEMFHRQYAAVERTFETQDLVQKLEVLSKHLSEKPDAESGESDPVAPEDIHKVLKRIKLKAEQIVAFSEDPEDFAADGKKMHFAQPKVSLYTSRMVNAQGAIIHAVAPSAFNDSPLTTEEMKRFWAEIRRLEKVMRRELFWGSGNIVVRFCLLIYSSAFIFFHRARVRGL